jgi:hypothetical protein
MDLLLTSKYFKNEMILYFVNQIIQKINLYLKIKIIFVKLYLYLYLSFFNLINLYNNL